jgi:hypothetical protein
MMRAIQEVASAWQEIKSLRMSKQTPLISPCKKYRYWLTRWWDKNRPLAVFIMLNPSRANAAKDDPTIHCCVRLAQREGFGGIRVVNLFALRTPSRSKLARHQDPVGPDNDLHLRRAVQLGAVVILAWGEKVVVKSRPLNVLRRLRKTAKSLKCIEILKRGQPRHPLFLPKKATLIDFE